MNGHRVTIANIHADPAGPGRDQLSGWFALHGGGEFQPGDERFLRAVLETMPVRPGPGQIVIVPTAAARGAPDRVAAMGIAAFERIAASLERHVLVSSTMVVDLTSADDPAIAQRLEAAALIYFPGGDPDLIPTIVPGTLAGRAVIAALAAGATLVGASAGAMAMGSWTWTPGGQLAGLGLIPGIVVVPHADGASWQRSLARFGGDPRAVPGLRGVLGLAERTGLLIDAGARSGGRWLVAGEGEARWLTANGAHDSTLTAAKQVPLVAADGGLLDTRDRPSVPAG